MTTESSKSRIATQQVSWAAICVIAVLIEAFWFYNRYDLVGFLPHGNDAGALAHVHPVLPLILNLSVPVVAAMILSAYLPRGSRAYLSRASAFIVVFALMAAVHAGLVFIQQLQLFGPLREP